MSKNRGVVYIKPGVVEVRDIPDPKFEDPHGRKINHAVILKIISTNICGCRRVPRHDGTQRTWKLPWRMSAFGRKADLPDPLTNVR